SGRWKDIRWLELMAQVSHSGHLTVALLDSSPMVNSNALTFRALQRRQSVTRPRITPVRGAKMGRLFSRGVSQADFIVFRLLAGRPPNSRRLIRHAMR